MRWRLCTTTFDDETLADVKRKLRIGNDPVPVDDADGNPAQARVEGWWALEGQALNDCVMRISDHCSFPFHVLDGTSPLSLGPFPPSVSRPRFAESEMASQNKWSHMGQTQRKG